MQQLIAFEPDTLRELIQSAVREAVSTPVPPILNKKQLAKYLGKSLSTIEKYMREGMPYYKYDEKSYPEFTKTKIDKWIEERGQVQESEVVQ